MILGFSVEELSNDEDKISKIFFDEDSVSLDTASLIIETQSRVQKVLILNKNDLQTFVQVVSDYLDIVIDNKE